MSQISPTGLEEAKMMCWFCEREPAHPEASVSVFLKKDISTESTLKWKITKANSREIVIPRCKPCQEFRNYTKNLGKFVSWMIILLIVLVAAGFAINPLLPENFPRFIAPVVGGLLGIAVISLFARKIRKPENYAIKYDIGDYPEYEALRNDGWEIVSTNY